MAIVHKPRWEEGWPKDWCRAAPVPLPKKGNLKECSNSRTISHISHVSKFMLRIIINRMKVKLEEEISVRQAGFREGRGTRDQIVNITNIKEHQMDDHDKNGFPKHLTDLVSKLYEDQESVIRAGVGSTEWFSIGMGPRQGCILSASLFNVYSEDIMREALRGFEGGVRFEGERITDLRYADNTTLICSNRNELIDLLRRVKEASEKKGLLLNTKKTKIMVIDKQSSGEDFLLDSQVIEEVSEFGYLGSLVGREREREGERERERERERGGERGWTGREKRRRGTERERERERGRERTSSKETKK